MYEGIDFLGATKELAEQVIVHDRNKYRNYYKIILDFLRSHQKKCFVGGTHACAAFDAREFKLDDLVMDASVPIIIFCETPKEMGQNLMAALIAALSQGTELPQIDELHLFSRNPGAEYQMNTSARRFCVFRLLGIYRETPLTSLMRPPIISGIACVSPEIMLIDIYRRIFLAPDDEEDDVGNRNTLLKLESRLFDRLYGERQKIIAGTAEVQPAGLDLLGLKRLILARFKDHIILGRQACQPNKNLDGLQAVVTLPNNDINHAIQEAVNEWKAAIKGTPPDVEIKRFFLSLPVDTRLIRFRVTINSRPIVRVIDIFNAGNYDLLARDHPFTVFRFLLVDIWTNNLVRKIMSGNKGVEHAIKNSVEQMIGWMHSKRSQVIAANKRIFKDVSHVNELMPLFIGTTVNEQVAARQERRGAMNTEIIWAGRAPKPVAVKGGSDYWELGGIPDLGVFGFVRALAGIPGMQGKTNHERPQIPEFV